MRNDNRYFDIFPKSSGPDATIITLRFLFDHARFGTAPRNRALSRQGRQHADAQLPPVTFQPRREGDDLQALFLCERARIHAGDRQPGEAPAEARFTH